MYKMKGLEQWICDECLRPSCIWPGVCRNLDTDHTPLLEIYKAVRETEGVKHAFVTSGLRYDLFLHEHATPAAKKSHERYVDELVEHHVSGRLKVAPEHTSDDVLRVMRKPSFSYFHRFKAKFDAAKKKFDKRTCRHPVFHQFAPGSTAKDMANLAVETKALGFKLEQGAGLHAHADDGGDRNLRDRVHPTTSSRSAWRARRRRNRNSAAFSSGTSPRCAGALRATMRKPGWTRRPRNCSAARRRTKCWPTGDELRRIAADAEGRAAVVPQTPPDERPNSKRSPRGARAVFTIDTHIDTPSLLRPGWIFGARHDYAVDGT